MGWEGKLTADAGTKIGEVPRFAQWRMKRARPLALPVGYLIAVNGENSNVFPRYLMA